MGSVKGKKEFRTLFLTSIEKDLGGYLCFGGVPSLPLKPYFCV